MLRVLLLNGHEHISQRFNEDAESNMRKTFLQIVTGIVLLASTAGIVQRVAAQQSKPQSGVPVFQLDPAWPKLPEKLKQWGPLFGIAVDSHDHVWIIQRPVRAKDKEQAGPPIMEFDAAGNYLQGWG